jgi:ElaB/YqjD/DUF883 family membrane-anchored ribosome-binding protein
VPVAKPEQATADFTESDEQLMASIQQELREAESLLKSRPELSQQEMKELRVRVNRCQQVLMNLTYVKTRGTS